MAPVTSLEERSDRLLAPEEVALHVLDSAHGSPPWRWTPTDRNIGDVEPTGIVVESGFVVYADGTVNSRAARGEAGIRAVGNVERDTTRPVGSVRPAPLCGAGLLGPALLLIFALATRRTGRRAHRY